MIMPHIIENIINNGMFIPFMDIKDEHIINILKENSRLSTQKISKKTGLPITTVYNRIKKLEKDGIIKKYSVVLDKKKLGKNITAYVLIYFNRAVIGEKLTYEQLAAKFMHLPFIESMGYITGRYDIILKVSLNSIEELDNLVLDALRKIPGVGRTETMISMKGYEND